MCDFTRQLHEEEPVNEVGQNYNAKMQSPIKSLLGGGDSAVNKY